MEDIIDAVATIQQLSPVLDAVCIVSDYHECLYSNGVDAAIIDTEITGWCG